MNAISPTVIAIGLDVTMIFYTMWVISLGKGNGKMPLGIGLGMFTWLAALHFGLSTKSIFPPDISGVAFLAIVVMAVGVVGALLFFVPPVRNQLLALDQQQLMLMQGIRVFFGANFLMSASTGNLPVIFGILDGWTHISAGFLGLIAAFTLSRGVDGNRRAWFANLFGIMDILVVASTIALVLVPTITPHHNIMYALFFPGALWLWFHLVSVWKLLQAKKVVTKVVHA